MSGVESSESMRYDDFENLKDQIESANLTDAQITDLALILTRKFEENHKD